MPRRAAPPKKKIAADPIYGSVLVQQLVNKIMLDGKKSTSEKVDARRANTLALRWMVGFARARREKTMGRRLAGEILDAKDNIGSSVKRKEDTHRMAEANRAFAHYRW
jgi:small subunit ribosomal protein S7